MTRPATLSSLPEKRFWGWGYLDDGLTAAETAAARRLVQALGRPGPDLAAPRLDEFALRAPRKPAPDALQDILSATPYDRLTHAYGKSFADVARMWMRHVPHAPDWVAYPRNEADIARILDWAAGANVAVVPFGGGTSVVGGVEPDVGASYDATVSLDMERFDGILEIDRTSRAARIGAGMLGPALEAALRPHGLTLRHFPQSFQFSTLGGWIATRAGGHFATQYTHIDDFVESTRVISPAGVFETRRLPASGAGPAPDRLVIGSEGIFGVIIEAWMRLQDRPRFRASASVRFATVAKAVSCIRALSQSGLQPTNCRLLDAAEVAFARVGDGKTPTLIIGFESPDHPLDAWIARALELAADHGGAWDADELERSVRGDDLGSAQRKGSAGEWRNAFLRMPYWRDETTRLGAILDTFESAVTWSGFDAFYDGVRTDVADAIERVTGVKTSLSCRFTHVYPDGPAPYFTFMAQGDSDGNIGNALARWRDIKAACNDAVIRHGGTSTHHHAVGRDHRSGYEKEVPDLMRQAFAGAKSVLDPSGIMNPGVLIDPHGRTVGFTGATGAGIGSSSV
ncbi:FAD-binding oxidoreductase [Bradyrhizobium sp. SZCCHNPS1003]|uniref:FAD-binding oxidoreductase n=1 Tax=Bradyrhizobium sp. SZCCHNPS1003 TaxID=3057330 RepID=UPI0028E64004|nr:FAD-binding oxidoreductase [Bradyrhizobium sp. SZCCHNPS1003]